MSQVTTLSAKPHCVSPANYFLNKTSLRQKKKKVPYGEEQWGWPLLSLTSEKEVEGLRHFSLVGAVSGQFSVEGGPPAEG